jgi:hypothetical protein
MILVNEAQQYVASVAGQPNRDLHLEVPSLEPGTYYLYTEVDWCQSMTDEYVITAYGRANVEFQGDYSGSFSKLECLKQIFMSKAQASGNGSLSAKDGVARADMGKYGAKGIVKYTDLSAKEGYAYIYYVNDEAEKTYKEELTFTTFNGAELLHPYSGSKATVVVKPQSEEILVVKLAASWGLAYQMGSQIYS